MMGEFKRASHLSKWNSKNVEPNHNELAMNTVQG